MKSLLLLFKIYETPELPRHAFQHVNLSFSTLVMQKEYCFCFEPFCTGSKDMPLSLGTSSFKSVVISKSCFKASVNISLPPIISLRYPLKILEDGIFLFIVAGKDSRLDAFDEI